MEGWCSGDYSRDNGYDSLAMCFSDLLNPVVRVAYSVVWFDVTEHGVVKPKMGDEKKGPASDSVDALTDEAQKQFERFVQGAHQMTACALAAIDACSADVPQTVQLLELLVCSHLLNLLKAMATCSFPLTFLV